MNPTASVSDYLLHIRDEIDIDAPQLFLEKNLPQAPSQPLSRDDPALLMYTSGTTGKPKGANRAWRKTGLESVADMILQVGIRGPHFSDQDLEFSHGKGFESFERRAAPTLLVVSYHKMAAQEGAQQAQQVAVAKVLPLRVNLPTHGVRHAFTQVLQTEVGKPMTVRFAAVNDRATSWPARFGLSAAGFVVLWLAVSGALARRERHTAGIA